MLISAKIYNNQRAEKAVVLDSNYTGVEEQCIPGKREDSHVLPSQHMCCRSPNYSASIKDNTWRAALCREIQL